jgi:hypothetical protein
MDAARLAAERNAELVGGQVTTAPTFEPITVAELRRRFLDQHEHVLCSSLATVNRYRTATAYLETFAVNGGRSLPADRVVADPFLRWLRRPQIAPNGHPSSRRRPLRERGTRFILNTSTSLAKKPTYSSGPNVFWLARVSWRVDRCDRWRRKSSLAGALARQCLGRMIMLISVVKSSSREEHGRANPRPWHPAAKA